MPGGCSYFLVIRKLTMFMNCGANVDFVSVVIFSEHSGWWYHVFERLWLWLLQLYATQRAKAFPEC